jgi:hypothetical protein
LMNINAAWDLIDRRRRVHPAAAVSCAEPAQHGCLGSLLSVQEDVGWRGRLRSCEGAVTIAGEIAKRLDAQLMTIHVMRRIGSDRVPETLKRLARSGHVALTEADALRGRRS